MYEGMKNLREQFEALLENAKSIHQGKSGTLRIGLIGADRIDERTLMIFDRFQEKHPGVELLLRRGSHRELLQWLYEQKIDLSFSLKIDVDSKEWIDYAEAYSVDSVLILSASHPLAGKEGLSLADVKDDGFINISANESPVVTAMLKKEFEKAGFMPKMLDAPDVNSQMLYLESGRGVAVGSVNNLAGFNPRVAMLYLRELKPLKLAVAWNRYNINPCLPLFKAVISS